MSLLARGLYVGEGGYICLKSNCTLHSVQVISNAGADT